MRKSSKVLLTAGCAVALFAASAFGTIAYFTDSDAVTNTFSVGQVSLELDEALVNANGEVVSGERVKENAYHLIPGETYVKDPTVHITAGSENCYVFVTVKNQIADIEWKDDSSYQRIATQMTMNGWELLSKIENQAIEFVKKDGVNVYVYGGDKAPNHILPKSSTQTDLIVFEEFRIDGDNVIARKDVEGNAPEGIFYIDDYATEATNGTTVVVTAYAVQADGFDTALDAWNATYAN